MTREEAIKMLANTKVYVQGKSKEIQEKLFSLGFQWKFDGKKVCHEEKPFLFLWEDMELSYGSDMERFTKKAFREIAVADILSIVIDEPKYRPFKDAEECWKKMTEQPCVGYIRHKPSRNIVHINSFEDQYICIGDTCYNFSAALMNFEFLDGTPFGIKED